MAENFGSKSVSSSSGFSLDEPEGTSERAAGHSSQCSLDNCSFILLKGVGHSYHNCLATITTCQFCFTQIKMSGSAGSSFVTNEVVIMPDVFSSL